MFSIATRHLSSERRTRSSSHQVRLIVIEIRVTWTALARIRLAAQRPPTVQNLSACLFATDLANHPDEERQHLRPPSTIDLRPHPTAITATMAAPQIVQCFGKKRNATVRNYHQKKNPPPLPKKRIHGSTRFPPRAGNEATRETFATKFDDHE